MKVKGINFSYAYSRGSKVERIEKTWQLGQQVFDRVIQKFDEQTSVPIEQKSIPISNLRGLLKENLPEMLKFSVKKTPKEEKVVGSLTSTYNSTAPKRYIMEVPAEDNKLFIRHVSTLIHETIHLLDRALQPQFQAVESQMSKRGLSYRFSKFYNEVFYTNKGYSKFSTKRKTNKFLKGMSIEDRLLALRFFKLNMETETRAYQASNNIDKSLVNADKDKIFMNQLAYQNYNFERNIKLVDKMRADIIKKERNKIKRAHKNS